MGQRIVPQSELQPSSQRTVAPHELTPDDISPAPAPEDKGALESFGAVFGPTHPAESHALVDDFKKWVVDHPMDMMLPPIGISKYLATRALEHAGAAGKAGYHEAGEALQNIKEGGPVAANIGKMGAGMVDFGAAATAPAGGEVINTLGKQVAKKNYRGAAGTAAGALTAVAIPKLAEVNAKYPNATLSDITGRPKIEVMAPETSTLRAPRNAPPTIDVEPDGAVKPQRALATTPSKQLAAAPPPPPSPYLEHANAIVALANAAGGATYNLRRGDLSGKRGYAVAMWPERDLVVDTLAPNTVASYIERNHDILTSHPNVNVGVFPRPDGKTQLELSVDTPVKSSAIEMGRRHNQLSVWDLARAQDVPTGGTGGITDAPKGDAFVAQGAAQYNASRGRAPLAGNYVQPDARAPEIADEYDALAHAPADPMTARSYAAMKNDIADQWDYATKQMGMKFEPWTKPGQPYANSAEMKADVANNHHLYFYTGGEMPLDHPLAAINPQTNLSYNDMFRAIHDLFGHSASGFEFGPRGEENAWLKHSQMFSPEAVPAMTTETRGQNSWVNAGPHMRDAETGELLPKGHPRYLPPQARPFAEQKAGLLSPEYQGRDEIGRLASVDFGPERAPFMGRHYSPTSIKGSVLSGARRGTSGLGVEVNRLSLGKGGPPGVYVVPEGFRAHPSYSGRPYEYPVRGNFAIADIATNPVWQHAFEDGYLNATAQGLSHAEALAHGANAAEHGLMEEGYDGYAHHYYPETTFLFGDVPVHQPAEMPEPVLANAAAASASSTPAPAPADAVSPIARQNEAVLASQQQRIAAMAAQHPDLAAAVERGGGKFGGIQEGYGPIPSHVLFHAPSGTTLALPLDGVTPEAVAQRIQQSVDPGGIPAAVVKAPVAAPARLKPGSLLTNDERAQLAAKRKGMDEFLAASKTMSVKQFVAAARAGAVGRKWYDRSRAAFHSLHEALPEYFHDGDFEKWANVVAATSPQQPVPMNLREALTAWKAWHDAGRPLEDAAIKRAIDPVLVNAPSKLPNFGKAVRGENMLPPDKKMYFKVGNFGRNLAGMMNNVTNDTWMGVFARGLSGDAGQKAVSRAPVYHAIAEHTRAAAHELGWAPAEAQAAIWTFTKTLAEMSGWKGTAEKVDPKLILREKDIFGSTFNEERMRDYAKDFADIMRTDPEVRAILKDLGVNLDELDKRLERIPRAEADPEGLTQSARKRLGPVAARIRQAQSGLESGARGDAETPASPVAFPLPSPIARAVASRSRRRP